MEASTISTQPSEWLQWSHLNTTFKRTIAKFISVEDICLLGHEWLLPYLPGKIQVNYSHFLLASRHGHLKIVKWIVRNHRHACKPVRMYRGDPFSSISPLSCLDLAAMNNNFEVLQFLLVQSQNQLPLKKLTRAIDSSSSNGNIRILSTLLDHLQCRLENSNEINCANTSGILFSNFSIALQRSAEFGHLDVVTYLYTMSPKIDHVSLSNWLFAFKKASENGHIEIVQFIYKLLEKYDRAHNHFESIHQAHLLALEKAASKGQLSVVMYLHFELNKKVAHDEKIKTNQTMMTAGCLVPNTAKLIKLSLGNGHGKVVQYLYSQLSQMEFEGKHQAVMSLIEKPLMLPLMNSNQILMA